MANLSWPNSDCLTTWTTIRIHKILLLHLWMGQQSLVSSLLKKGLACQKISGTRNQECGKSTTSGTKKILLPSMHLKLGLMKNSVKAMNQEETAFTYLREKFPRLSEAKLKEGIFIGRQIWDIIKDEYFDRLLQGDEKAAWDSFKFVVKVFLGNRRAQNYAELVNNLFAELPEIRMQHVTKNTLPSLAFGFFPGELLWSEWWIRRAFPSRHFFNGEEISREMKLCYARRLLLDFGNGCPYHGIQATGEKKKKIILFVLNNELTWKRLCRCSIYVVNIISTQSKSTKHVIFQWIVFSFLFNPPFRIIFQPIS